MGKGSSGAVVMPTQDLEPVVTPAVAQSIAQDTQSAQDAQLKARQRMRGVSSTYLRGVEQQSAGGKTKLGQ